MNKRTILSLIILAVALAGAVIIVSGADYSTMNLTIQVAAPRRPILNFPTSNGTTSYAVGGGSFEMTATVLPNGGSYVKFKQEVYSNEACTNVVQSNSQTSTQTGWYWRDASSSNAYVVGNATGTTALFQLTTALSASSTYYWGAQAYDPDSSGAWGTSTLTRVDNDWTATEAMSSTEYQFGGGVYNGYIYEFGGGELGSVATTTTRYAHIQSDGSISPWTNTTALPSSTYLFAYEAYNGYLYKIGGYDRAGNPTSSVLYAQIQPGGTLESQWHDTTPLPTSTMQLSSAAYNGYIYAVGGAIAGSSTSTVLYAQIQSDGSLEASWHSATKMPFTTYRQTSVAYNGYLYVIGGCCSVPLGSSTRYVQINSTGSLASVWQYTTPLNASSYWHSLNVYNGYLYKSGGYFSNQTATVQYAPISATGSLDSWAETNPMPKGRDRQVTVVSNGYMYQIGGLATGDQPTSSVIYSRINEQGKTADEGWVNHGSVTSSISLNRAVSYGGYLYSIGGTSDGTNGTTTVNYFTVNSNGTLTNMGSTTVLLSDTVQHGAFVYRGIMYVVGGSSTVSVAGNQVVQSAISNGTLGTWSTSSAQLPADYNNSFVGVNPSTGYVYLVGGDDTSNATSAVLYGLISSTGTIPNWSSTNPLPDAMTKQGGIILNDMIYSIGGVTSTAADVPPTTTVNMAPLNSDGSVASWTVATALPAPLTKPSVQTYNNFIYVTGGSSTVAYGGVTSTILYAQQIRDATGTFLNGTGTLSSWLAATALPAPLYQEGSAIANGYLYTVGGKTTGGTATSTIQNIGLYTSCVPFTTPPITNNPPSVTSVSLNHGSTTLILTPNATTSFDINYTVTDQDGCTNIVNMTSTAFRLGVASTCAVPNPTTNNLNCYSFITHTTSSCISDTQYIATDTVDIYYFAQSTGDASATFPNDQWEAYAFATDAAGATSSATSSARHVGVLTSIDLSTTTINYGSLYTNTNTSSTNQIEGITNVGNSSATLSISGTAFVSGVNSIATDTQHYATTTFIFGSAIETALSSTAALVPGISIPAHIDTTPLVQSWANTQSLPTGTYAHSSAVYNSYVYVIGGYAPTATSTVRFAQMQSSTGALGSWTDTTALPAGITGHSSVAYNGYLYVIGGNTEAGLTSTVRYAQINATGSLGAWADTQALPTSTYVLSSVAYSGYMYEIGGYNATSTNVTSAVRYARINATGSLGAWTNTQAMPTGTGNHSSVVSNGYVYVIGGTADVPTSTVRYSQIQSSGALGSWTDTAVLPSSTYYGQSAIAYNGYIYEMGGVDASENVTSTVRYSQIQSNGTLGSWTNTQTLPTSTAEHSSVVSNGYVYVIGGYDAAAATTTVRYVSLDSRQIYWGMAMPSSTPAGSYQSTSTYTANWAP